MGLFGIGDNLFRYIGQREQNMQNMALAKQAQAFEQKMWNQTNVYNSPEQQMIRLKEANLNPNLMYGQGNVGNATSSPRAHVPDYQSPLSNIGIPDIIGMMNGIATLEKTMAETGRIREDTLLKRSGVGLTDLKAITLDELMQYGFFRSKATNEEISSRVNFATEKEKVEYLKTLYSKAGLDYTEKDITNQLKQIELTKNEELAKYNLNQNSNDFYKVFIRVLEMLTGGK